MDGDKYHLNLAWYCADAGYPRLGPLGTEGRGYAAGYELDSEVTERER